MDVIDEGFAQRIIQTLTAKTSQFEQRFHFTPYFVSGERNIHCDILPAK
jgi:hypothetical protein